MPSPTELEQQLRAIRPRRGAPAHTRERLIAAAAHLFNRVGFRGTDSNRIARRAGYSPGVFYKHFKDKREIFLVVYERWVASEWKAAALHVESKNEKAVIVRRLVENVIEFHTKWKGLRASLIALVYTDPQIRRFYRDQRRRQLNVLARLREEIGAHRHNREDDAVLLYTLERTCDAIANHELGDLELRRAAFITILEERVAAALT